MITKRLERPHRFTVWPIQTVEWIVYMCVHTVHATIIMYYFYAETGFFSLSGRQAGIMLFTSLRFALSVAWSSSNRAVARHLFQCVSTPQTNISYSFVHFGKQSCSNRKNDFFRRNNLCSVANKSIHNLIRSGISIGICSRECVVNLLKSRFTSVKHCIDNLITISPTECQPQFVFWRMSDANW